MTTAFIIPRFLGAGGLHVGCLWFKVFQSLQPRYSWGRTRFHPLSLSPDLWWPQVCTRCGPGTSVPCARASPEGRRQPGHRLSCKSVHESPRDRSPCPCSLLFLLEARHWVRAGEAPEGRTRGGGRPMVQDAVLLTQP